MKVLQVSTHFNVGGISNYILTLSKALKACGVDTLVVSSGGDLEGHLEAAGIRHNRIDIKTKFEFGPKAVLSGFRIAGTVKTEGIELIHAHSRVSQVAAAIASKLTGIPYITTCHGYFKKRSRGFIDTWGEKVIAISEAVRRHLTDDLHVEASRIELIYSGVDEKAFSGEYPALEIASLKRSYGLDDGPVIGTIGRLSPVKGQKYLVAAMKDIVSRMPDAQCIIVGNGPEEKALKLLAGSLGISSNIRFIESCADTFKYLSMMDIFVFPSVKEGLGIALLEALASGRACIASRTGGIEDVISDGVSGILVSVGDSSAIADGVVKLLGDRQLRKKLGDEARALVRNRFAVASMAGDISRLYSKVAGG